MADKRRAQFQCMNCGTIHWIEDPPDIDEDELYTKLRCSRCKQTVNHLWVGTEPGDEYLYYDVTKDGRYY
jgi:DNA-directed RNA polymerase subunit RPC12/RpoP